MRKGQKHTKKSREKLRVKHLGKPGYWKGKKLSYNHIKKMSDTHKKIGDKPPSRRGTIPWNYRGATKLQELIRKCFEYRQWRSDVFQRDDYTCQHCGIKGGILNADHIKLFSVILKEYNIKTLEEALKCEELWNINNGRTLHKHCHKNRKFWDNKLLDNI